MSPLLKNIIAVVVGLAVGMLVNMGIILISGYIIPLPEGVNAADSQSLKEGMHLFEFKHFIFPFLAHALGTLVGVLVAVRIGVSHTVVIALLITAFFMLGGIYSAWQIQGPYWYTVIDLTFAYMPIGLLGWVWGRKEGVPALGKK